MANLFITVIVLFYAPGKWIDRKPSQEKMKDLAKGKQYFIEKSEVYKILEDSGKEK